MRTIPREARRITYSTKIRNLKQRLSLNDEQKAVVIGSVLGDGTLAENWSKTNFRLKISHSIHQNEYILWKYEMLREWFLSEPSYYEKTKSVTIRTVSHQELTAFRKIFYQENRKIIPENIVTLIRNPITIAVWFMDDGNCIRRNGKIIGFHINTQSFTLEEHYLLVQALQEAYGLEMRLEGNHNKYRLAAYHRYAREKLRNIITPFILPSMQYKIS